MSRAGAEDEDEEGQGHDEGDDAAEARDDHTPEGRAAGSRAQAVKAAASQVEVQGSA